MHHHPPQIIHPQPHAFTAGAKLPGAQFVSFHDHGEQFALASSSEISICSLHTGKVEQYIYAKSSPISAIAYTQHRDGLLYGTGGSFGSSIKLLSLYDNCVIRSFNPGTSSSSISSLSIHPTEETFVTTFNDGTFAIFDPKCPQPVYKGMLTCGPVYFTHDKQGLVAAAVHGENLNLFDSRNYNHKPFASYKLGKIVNSVLFSPDGKLLLVGDGSQNHLIVDSFNGTVLNSLFVNESSLTSASCFTPTSSGVVLGSSTGTLNVLSLRGLLESSLTKIHNHGISCIASSPSINAFVSVAEDCSIIWIPS
ncbi:hypothetical protein P9112_013562 [Eukaryota sp. TZLM1-RC]